MSSRRLGVVRPLLQMGLIPQITLGIIAGVLLAVVWPETAQSVSLLGQLFISALKAVAPILVFALVTAAIANHRQGQPTHIRGVLLLYVIGTLVAAVVAIGFVISVVQDSTETALNSSTDVLFTAAACRSAEAREAV